ncbi:MAG: ABC transporter substrate-binding protein [Actinomycetota bacterium]
MSNYPSPSAWAQYVSRRGVIKGGAAAGGLVAMTPLLAACGDDDEGDSGSGGFSGSIGSASGTLKIGSRLSNPAPEAGLAAVAAAFPNENVTIEIDTTDSNTFQENINTILQAQESDIIAWFAGFRNRFFADQGLVGDISDVWDATTGLGEGFKAASTASDGKQYFLPTTYYTWAVNYNKNVFEENGWSEPTTKDEMLSLADDMASAGLTPFGYANDGNWPLMGTFDAINLRVNGYDFHVSLMAGNESWTSDEVRAVFTEWAELLPYAQDGANGRTWEEAAVDLEEGRTGMYLLGTFAASAMSDGSVMDFFNFPEYDSSIGAAALDAPIDGFQMLPNPDNEAAAKEFLLWLSQAESQDIFATEDNSVVASNSGADTSVFSDLQKKSAELANAATGISQFLDRDTIPAFANECGTLFAQFIEDPGSIDEGLADLEEKKVVIFEEFNS